jgi:hypothetical protein
MARGAPFRSKPPPLVQSRLQLLGFVRLYLIAEPGPACFVVRCEGPEAGEDGGERPSAVEGGGGGDGGPGDSGDTSAGLPTTAGTSDAELRLAQTSGTFRVTIGDVQACSCGQEELCVHILFVMVRIFRLEKEDTLVWQRALVDSEIERLLDERERAQLQALRGAQRAAADKGCVLCVDVNVFLFLFQ